MIFVFYFHWISYIMVSIIRRKKGKNKYCILIYNTGKHQHEKYQCLLGTEWMGKISARDWYAEHVRIHRHIQNYP